MIDIMKKIQIIYKYHNYHIECVIGNKYVDAIVLDMPSPEGINQGRIVSLTIAKTMVLDHDKGRLEQMDYNYERGLIFSRLTRDEVNSFVEVLEKLPIIEA